MSDLEVSGDDDDEGFESSYMTKPRFECETCLGVTIKDLTNALFLDDAAVMCVKGAVWNASLVDGRRRLTDSNVGIWIRVFIGKDAFCYYR